LRRILSDSWSIAQIGYVQSPSTAEHDANLSVQRVEAFGWDRQEREYLVLDDNRLYRHIPWNIVEEQRPAQQTKVKPKANSKKGKAIARASKRLRNSTGGHSEDVEEEEMADILTNGATSVERELDILGGLKWEVVARTLDEYRSFLSSIEKSKDPNEKDMRNRLIDDVMPIIEQAEEDRQKEEAKKEREREVLAKLATAKRSGRLASKAEKQKEEEEALEARRREQIEKDEARKFEAEKRKQEKVRLERLQTREKRLKDRENQKAQHEDELRKLAEDSERIENEEAGRKSSRHLHDRMEKVKQALEETQGEEESWFFDCSGCGVYGDNFDDGTPNIACDQCNVWQHLKCLGITEEQADDDSFKFVCKTCVDKEKHKDSPKIRLKLNFGSSGGAEPESPSQKAIASAPINGHSPSGSANASLANVKSLDVEMKDAPLMTAEIQKVASPSALTQDLKTELPSSNGTYSATNGAAKNVPDMSPPLSSGPNPLLSQSVTPAPRQTIQPTNGHGHSSPFADGLTTPKMGSFTGSQNPAVTAEQSPWAASTPKPASQESPLPPSSGGLSPTKVSQIHFPANGHASQPSVLPPAPTLSPIARQQNLSVPIKSSPPEPLP
jgi:PHD-finger